LTKLLVRLFIRNYEHTGDESVRGGYGKLAGIVGILCNVLLFAMKLLVGTLTSSIAITADAFNNLSDAGSSVITLIGFKISAKPADKEHPYGHQRLEYIAGFIVSMIILLLGLELIRSSFEKILRPDPIQFNPAAVVVLAAAIGVKLWLGLFYRKIGKTIHSTTLEATATDSMNDVFATASVLASTIFGALTGIQTDGYMGVAVALFIIYSGIRLIKETTDPLLGNAPDEALVKIIEDKIKSYEGVIGLHDLVVHNYGPERCFASVHVEVCAKRDIMESHEMIDRIERDFNTQLKIHLVIHMDPVVTDDPRINNLKEQVADIVHRVDPVLSMHDFRVVFGKSISNLIFDITVPPAYKISDVELSDRINRMIHELDPGYNAVITLDRSYISNTPGD